MESIVSNFDNATMMVVSNMMNLFILLDEHVLEKEGILQFVSLITSD